MMPKTKPEELSAALRIIADWFDNKSVECKEDGDFWRHTIRARALDEAANYIDKLQKCRSIIEHIASDGIELSWDKIELQRNRYIDLCTKMRNELYSDE